MELLISYNAPHGWNEYLKKSLFGTIYQSEEYASYLSEASGKKPLFVQLISEKEVKAMALIFLSPQIFSQRLYTPFTSPIFRILSKIKPFYWTFYGPLNFGSSLTLEKFLIKIRSSLFKQGSKAVFIPHPLCDQPSPFLKQGFVAKQLMTCIIDLRQDFETLLKKMDKKSALKNAERALRRGVQIYEATTLEDFETYYQILVQSRKRVSIRPYSKSEVFPLFNMIKKNIMKCFIALKGEKPLAGILMSTFNGYLNEWGAAQTLEDISQHLYGNDLLRYYIIKWGHENGYRFYDQSGVSKSSMKDFGIFRYKSKWGGEIITYNKYSFHFK